MYTRYNYKNVCVIDTFQRDFGVFFPIQPFIWKSCIANILIQTRKTRKSNYKPNDIYIYNIMNRYIWLDSKIDIIISRNYASVFFSSLWKYNTHWLSTKCIKYSSSRQRHNQCCMIYLITIGRKFKQCICI